LETCIYFVSVATIKVPTVVNTNKYFSTQTCTNMTVAIIVVASDRCDVVTVSA